MRWAWAILLLPLTGCLSGDPTGQPEATIYTGGTIWTGDEPSFAEAVAVAGDRILAVGTLDEVRGTVAPDSPMVDLEGRMLLPAFHDTHNHLLEWINGQTFIGLLGDDPAAVAPTTFDGTTGPVDQQPTGTLHVCHWGVQHAESAGESLIGDLPLEDQLVLRQNLARDACYMGILPGNDDAARAMALQYAQQVAFSFGLVSHIEAGLDHHDLDWFWQQDEAGAVQARFSVYVWPDSLDEVAAAGWTTGHGTDHMRLLGMKIYADGWLGPRTAALHEPFSDRPHRGFQFYEQAELDALVAQARAAGLKVTAHAIGERAIDAVLDAYQRAEGVACTAGPTCGDPRYAIEHLSLVSEGAAERLVRLDVMPSVQLSFPTSDAHWIDDALGERVERAYNFRNLTEAGVQLTASSDWPIEVLPPLWGIERAVTRQEVDGSLPQPWREQEAIDLETALRMVTVNAARAEFRDDLGRLAPGMLADLVVLEEDLFAIDPARIAEVGVAATMVGGEWVYGTVG